MTIRFPRTAAERPKNLVDVGKIVQAADAEVAGRRRHGDWRRSFVKAVPMPPLLVHGPIRSKGDYFIVDFRTAGKSTARIIYRAADGVLTQIAGLTSGQTELAPFFLPTELPAAVHHRLISYPDKKTAPFGKKLIIEKELVWAPCDQSLTPMEPFYVVQSDGALVYVRVDGMAFGELTEFVAGG